MGFRRVLLVFVCFLPWVSHADDSSPRELLAALNALQLDTQNVYTVTSKDRVELLKGDAVLSFQDGKIVFFRPFDGKVTGFVFTGIGHVLALPRDPVEKQQLARCLGAPVLDQQFLSAYVRFTDDTADQLLHELQRANLTPEPDQHLAMVWQPSLDRLNGSHSLRIVAEHYSPALSHFFHAGIDGALTGPFDILLDSTRSENFVLGQPRTADKMVYYDVWASYALPGFIPPSTDFDALHYRIDTVIHPDNSLEGTASIQFRALSGSEPILEVQLSRSLKVASVSDANGAPLTFFQNEGLTEQEINTRGHDTLIVFLPKTPAPNSEFTVNFHYAGNVIEDAGNGVLFVGARESWYPHFGDTSEFAYYELTFHWPKRLRLVATGTKSSEHDDGDSRTATWTTEIPVTQTGFNLGEYVNSSLTSGSYTIEVYANKQLEEILRAALASTPLPENLPKDPMMMHSQTDMEVTPAPPTPTGLLKQLAHQIDASIRFDETYTGPFPFRNLEVSQIPGKFGQGWPGLLYLSTFSFLPEEAQSRVGLSTAGRSFFNDVVPFHEVAHQWWGNVVGWSSYRDQWIDESIAEYLALSFAESQKPADHVLDTWLDRYRKRLITKSEEEDRPPIEVGPIIAGTRLNSSRSPGAYNVVIYAKGTWVIHMLREMLRQPNVPRGKDPDARFTALLRTLVTKYAQQALTTADLQQEVEKVMTKNMDLEGGRSMEWFFAQYVRGTNIPHYKVQFTSKRTEKGFQIRGKLLQSGVPESFIAPVPLYAATNLGRSVYLGTVTATGKETSFSFTSTTEPHKLLIDPHRTLLCVAE
jgi:Peptidase family M1 domain